MTLFLLPGNDSLCLKQNVDIIEWLEWEWNNGNAWERFMSLSNMGLSTDKIIIMKSNRTLTEWLLRSGRSVETPTEARGWDLDKTFTRETCYKYMSGLHLKVGWTITKEDIRWLCFTNSMLKRWQSFIQPPHRSSGCNDRNITRINLVTMCSSSYKLQFDAVTSV